LQSEYIVPRENAVQALRVIADMRDRISPHLHISEVRTIAADEFWLSPFYRQESVGIHFTWKDNWPAVRDLMPRIEDSLRPLGARPHWAKLHTVEKAASAYPRVGDFRSIMRQFDPTGKFRNAYLESIGIDG
jgi:xylitol oxidase